MTAGIAGIVGFLPFSESLEVCAGGAPPTAEDMLEGSDASGVEEGIVVAEGTDDRLCAARFNSVGEMNVAKEGAATRVIRRGPFV